MEATHEQALEKNIAAAEKLIEQCRAIVREKKGGNRRLMGEIDEYGQRLLGHFEQYKLPWESRPSKDLMDLEWEHLELTFRLLHYDIWNAPNSLPYMCKGVKAWFSKRFLPQTS